MSSVPSVKDALKAAVKAERISRKTLQGTMDVSTNESLDKSLRKMCDKSAIASNEVHDLKQLVDVEEKRLENEYHRCVRRLKGERQVLKRRIISPTVRKFEDLKIKIDRYEGLATCPVVAYAVEMCESAIREAKHLASEPADAVLASVVSSTGSISHKRLEVALKNVEEHALRARKRTEEVEQAMKEELPHLLDRLRRDAEQREELQGSFLHSERLLEKIEGVRNKNFSLRSFPYLNGFIENARVEVDRAASSLAKTTGLATNRDFRRALEARRVQILKAVAYTDKALEVLRKIDMSIAKNIMSKVRIVINRYRDKGALHELPHVESAVREADEHMIETNNRLIWLVKTFAAKPWELKERMSHYSAQVLRAKKLAIHALDVVREAEIFTMQEYAYRLEREATERSNLGETIPLLQIKLADAESIVKSHLHIGVDAIELEDKIVQARSIVEEAKRTHDETVEIRVASPRRAFDARIRRMHVVVREAMDALRSVTEAARRHDARAKRIAEMQKNNDERQHAEIRTMLIPGRELLQKIHESLDEDPEILQLVSRLEEQEANQRAEHVIELIQGRLATAVRNTNAIEDRLEEPLTRDLTDVSKRSRRKRRGTTFVLNTQDTSAGEMRKKASAALALIHDVHALVKERIATLTKQREDRRIFVERAIVGLRKQIDPIRRDLSQVKLQIASLKYNEDTIPTVNLSVKVADDALRDALDGFDDIDMSSDAAARDSLNLQTENIDIARRSIAQLGFLVDSIDLSLCEERLTLLRCDIESSPHGTKASPVVAAALAKASSNIRRVMDMMRTVSWADAASSMELAPVPILASFLWTTIAPDMKFAWHAVAKKVGWISEAEKMMRRPGESVATRKRKKKRRQSRFMQSTASSRKQNRRRRSTLNLKNLEALTLENASQMDNTVVVTKFGYDREKRAHASAASARQANVACAKAMAFAAMAARALTGGDTFCTHVTALSDARDAVRNAEAVVVAESAQYAHAHEDRRRRLGAAHEKIVREKIEPAKCLLAERLASLRDRWDGLGSVPRLIDAITQAKRGLDSAIRSLDRLSAEDPATQAALERIIDELSKAASDAFERVERMRSIFDEEDSRLAERRRFLKEDESDDDDEMDV
eukprot:g1763.t1